jgi:hypothetical protein
MARMHDAKGRSLHPMRARHAKIEGPFIAHLVEMRRSLAWSALSWNDRRFLDRLELEHADHGGTENGNLPCTYDDLRRHGLRRQSVWIAVVRTVALGFVHVTEQGHQAAGDNRTPSRYRLTYLPTSDGKPTHEWKNIGTEEQLASRLRTIKHTIAERKAKARDVWLARKQHKQKNRLAAVSPKSDQVF